MLSILLTRSPETVCAYVMQFNYVGLAGPDLGLGSQGQLPRGVHYQGNSPYVLVLYGRVASTAPLLKAAQGPPQPGDLLMSCHLLFFDILG